MTINAYQYYTPRNQFYATWTPNQRPFVSGNYHSLDTEYVTDNYTVTIRYTGPVDIGDRIIFSTIIPNYWNKNSAVDAEAARLSGNETCTPESSWPSGPIFCCLAGMIPCAVYCCIQNYRYAQIEAEKDGVSTRFMEQHITKLLSAADIMVDQRIARLNGPSASPSGFFPPQGATPARPLQQPMANEHSSLLGAASMT